MNPMLVLGPGSALPSWIETLDQHTFGSEWGPLEADERLWASPCKGYARWRIILAAQEAELLRIVVAPEARGKGFGRTLLRASCDALGELGIQTLHLEVRVSNAPARALYEHEGWQRTGIRKAYYQNGEDAVLYLKTLARDHVE